MMRLACILVLCAAVGACTKPSPKEADDAQNARQQPTPTASGLTVSGYATVGVIKSF